jgi:hypothetical protein
MRKKIKENQGDDWTQSFEKSIVAITKMTESFNRIGLEINPVERSLQGLPVLEENIRKANLKLIQLEKDMKSAKKIIIGFQRIPAPKTKMEIIKRWNGYFRNQVLEMKAVLAVAKSSNFSTKNKTMTKLEKMFQDIGKLSMELMKIACKSKYKQHD